jgi:hypothetical protein
MDVSLVGTYVSKEFSMDVPGYSGCLPILFWWCTSSSRGTFLVLFPHFWSW